MAKKKIQVKKLKLETMKRSVKPVIPLTGRQYYTREKLKKGLDKA